MLDVINAVALVVLVVVTGWYALSNARLLKEMARQRRIQTLAAMIAGYAPLVKDAYKEGEAKDALSNLLAQLRDEGGER